MTITAMSKIILGLDPGIADTGWGLIAKEAGNLNYLACGSITTSSKTDFFQRLRILHQELDKIIKKFRPQIVAVEELFFCKNVKTALMVGQARGVALMTIAQHGLAFFEYTPLQVKQALTSYGKADKNQVSQMVKVMLRLNAVPKPDDAADALAIAITCANSTK